MKYLSVVASLIISASTFAADLGTMNRDFTFNEKDQLARIGANPGTELSNFEVTNYIKDNKNVIQHLEFKSGDYEVIIPKANEQDARIVSSFIGFYPGPAIYLNSTNCQLNLYNALGIDIGNKSISNMPPTKVSKIVFDSKNSAKVLIKHPKTGQDTYINIKSAKCEIEKLSDKVDFDKFKKPANQVAEVQDGCNYRCDEYGEKARLFLEKYKAKKEIDFSTICQDLRGGHLFKSVEPRGSKSVAINNCACEGGILLFEKLTCIESQGEKLFEYTASCDGSGDNEYIGRILVNSELFSNKEKVTYNEAIAKINSICPAKPERAPAQQKKQAPVNGAVIGK